MKVKKEAKQAPKSVSHRDHYARISFLYQASNHFAFKSNYSVLSRSLARNVDLVSKKTVTKLSPSIKRSLCKKCSSLLIPGMSMSIFIENTSKQQSTASADVLVHQCKVCNEKKRYPIGRNRDYVVFSERKEVLINTSRAPEES
ncbi:uncharacterized protein PRCAT00002990001 [Priceomyces carsonii]|uniref:uncharacterized protein n=1 Tax=Priceomyces carsonii TaxID=28549 RepID=UPI002ED99061|nr:unnamed protein product [Priceomyces carsonii]